MLRARGRIYSITCHRPVIKPICRTINVDKLKPRYRIKPYSPVEKIQRPNQEYVEPEPSNSLSLDTIISIKKATQEAQLKQKLIKGKITAEEAEAFANEKGIVIDKQLIDSVNEHLLDEEQSAYAAEIEEKSRKARENEGMLEVGKRITRALGFEDQPLDPEMMGEELLDAIDEFTKTTDRKKQNLLIKQLRNLEGQIEPKRHFAMKVSDFKIMTSFIKKATEQVADPEKDYTAKMIRSIVKSNLDRAQLYKEILAPNSSEGEQRLSVPPPDFGENVEVNDDLEYNDKNFNPQEMFIYDDAIPEQEVNLNDDIDTSIIYDDKKNEVQSDWIMKRLSFNLRGEPLYTSKQPTLFDANFTELTSEQIIDALPVKPHRQFYDASGFETVFIPNTNLYDQNGRLIYKQAKNSSGQYLYDTENNPVYMLEVTMPDGTTKWYNKDFELKDDSGMKYMIKQDEYSHTEDPLDEMILSQREAKRDKNGKMIFEGQSKMAKTSRKNYIKTIKKKTEQLSRLDDMLVHVPLTSSTPPSSKLIIKDPSALTLPPSPSKSILNNPDPYINRPSKVTKNERRLQKYHRRKEEQLEEEQDKLIRDEAEATEDVSFREHYTVFPEEYNNEFDPTITNWAKMVMREELPSPDQQDEELVQLKNAFAMTASKEEMTIHGSEARRIQASLQAEISQQNIPMLDFNASRYTELMTDFEKGLPITAREQEWAQMATDGIVTQKSLINDLLMWLLSVEPAIRIRFVDYLRLTNHISLVSEIQKQMMRAKVMGANAIQHFREEMRREEWLNSKMIEGHHLVNVDVATQGEHILPALYKMQETHLLYTFPTHIQAEQGVPQHLLATEPMTLEEWRDWADNVTAQIASLDRQRHKYKDTIESIEYLRSQTKGPKKQEFSDGENADAAATTNDDHHQAEPEIESEKNAKKRDRLSQFLTEHPNAEVFDDDYKLDEDSNYPYLHDHNKIPQDMSEDDPIQFKIDLIEKYLQPWMDYRQVTDRTKQQLATDRSSNEEVFPLPDDLRHESTRVFRVPPKRRDHSFPSNAPPARLETSDGKPLQEHKEYEKIINHSEFLDESEFKYSIRPRLLGYPVARRSFYKYDAMLEDVLSNGTYNDRSGYAGTGFDASGNLDEGKQMNAYMDGNPFHDKDRESNQEHIQRPNRGDWFDIDEMAVVDDAYNHPEKQITTFDEFELAMSPFDDVRLDVAIQKRLNLGKHSFAKIKFQEICLKTGRNVVMKPKGKMEGFHAWHMVGSKNGLIGLAYGQSPSVMGAQEEARLQSYRNIRSVQTYQGLACHSTVTAKHGAISMKMVPWFYDGVSASPMLTQVCEWLGLRKVMITYWGNGGLTSVLMCFFKILDQLRTKQWTQNATGQRVYASETHCKDYMSNVRANRGSFGWY